MESTEKIIIEELEALKADIIQRQKDAGEMASGKTAEGYEVTAESALSGELLGYSYVNVLQTGRKPGKVPNDFKELIKKWIVAKGLQYQGEKELNRMAASIAWVIHKEGTALHRHGYKVDIFDTPIKNFTDRLTNRIAAYYTTEIDNELESWQQ